MSVPAEIRLGYVRRALQEFLGLVPELPPLGAPGEMAEAAIAAWCCQHGANDRAELGRRWAEQLDRLGRELFAAGLADRVRAGRPAEEPPSLLTIDRADDQAHALIRAATNKAEGTHRLRYIDARLAAGAMVPEEELETVARLQECTLGYSDVLTNVLYADAETFHVFIAAIRGRVERLLSSSIDSASSVAIPSPTAPEPPPAGPLAFTLQPLQTFRPVVPGIVDERADRIRLHQSGRDRTQQGLELGRLRVRLQGTFIGHIDCGSPTGC
jgi:hypothetical protein